MPVGQEGCGQRDRAATVSLGPGAGRPWWPFLRQAVAWTIGAAVGRQVCPCVGAHVWGKASFGVRVPLCVPMW